jgi:hypothetical protein
VASIVNTTRDRESSYPSAQPSPSTTSLPRPFIAGIFEKIALYSSFGDALKLARVCKGAYKSFRVNTFKAILESPGHPIHVQDLEKFSSFSKNPVLSQVANLVIDPSKDCEVVANHSEELADEQQLKKLKVLDFSRHSRPISGSGLISNEELQAFLHRCPNLRSLNLSGCVWIVIFSAIAKLCPNLEVLTLENTKVGNDDLMTIGEHCKHLSSIDLRSCRKITDKGFIPLIEQCRSLQKIGIPAGVSDDALDAIELCCRDLRSIQLSPGFGDKEIIALTQRFPNLAYLSPFFTKIYDKTQIEKLRQTPKTWARCTVS